MWRQLPLLLVGCLFVSCRASDDEEPAGAADAAPPGTIVGELTFGDDGAEVFLLADGADTPTRAGVDGNGRFDFGPLAGGGYRVSVKIPLALNGPWIYAHRRAEVSATRGASLRFSPPTPESAARVVLQAERGTPPFALLLARADADAPATLRELQERWDEDVLPSDEVLLLATSDGSGPARELPRVAAGDYLAVVCAIDWQEGDPPPRPRSLPVRLPARETRTLLLRDQLTVLELR
ncbi:MAG: hypothetical protein AAF682_25860 [Planctomycetota bacterium]